MQKLSFIAIATALLLSCSQSLNPVNPGDDNKEVIATAIKLNKNELTINKGESEVLSVSFTPSNTTDKTLAWSSSNNSVTSVSDGKVTAIAPGTADIIVKSGNLTDKCAVTVIIDVSSITLNKQSMELLIGETEALTVQIEPEETTEPLIWESSNESVATVNDGKVKAVALGDATIIAKAGSKKAECKVIVKEQVCPEGAVDMNVIVTREDGSTYKLFIAKCNLGANSPEEIGDYYAWGELEPKTVYSWESYRWCKESDIREVTKYGYNPEIDLWSVILEPEDDVAHVKLGGGWRMPTYAELDAIMASIGNTYTDEYYTREWKTINGNSGVEIVCKANGNSIFFPVSGYMNYSKIPSIAEGVVYFWSSSSQNFDPGSTDAWYMSIENKDTYLYFGHYTCSKGAGMPIRPVTK